MSKLICIGVGHGGKDPGACNGTRREADDNLRLAKAVGEKIQAQGHRALLTRESDLSMTPEERRQMAVYAGADLLIDLHRNSFSSATANGIEIWVRNSAHTAAASAVLEELCKLPHQSNRGVKIGSYAVLAGTPMPSMLLELGFISNEQDNQLYDQYFDENAEAIARGCLMALGETYKEADGTTADPNGLARIQLGAYTWPGNEAGARKALADIRALGLDAFLVIPDTATGTEG